MAFSKQFADYILELSEPIGPVTLRRMFGGACLKYGTATFALIKDDTVFLRVDEGNMDHFKVAKSYPFTYTRKNKEITLGSYYRMPDEALEDTELFVDWAKRSIDAAKRAERAKDGNS